MKKYSSKKSSYPNVKAPWCPNCRAHKAEMGDKCAGCGKKDIFIPNEIKNGGTVFLVLAFIFFWAAYRWSNWCVIPGLICLLVTIGSFGEYQKWAQWTKEEKSWKKKESDGPPKRKTPGQGESSSNEVPEEGLNTPDVSAGKQAEETPTGDAAVKEPAPPGEASQPPALPPNADEDWD